MILSGRKYFGDEPHGFYAKLLPQVEPGLMLDLGAAIGGYTRLMRSNSPRSRVIAFEPFSGNWPYFHERVGRDDMVTLKTCAVSDRAGKATFHVSSTVTAKSGFWSKFPGSSSVGALVAQDNVPAPKTWLWFHLVRPARGKSYEVETVALDDILDEPVRFMKMDVQGSETAVLKGCERLWKRHGIDMMSVEFTGKEPELLDLIVNRNYVAADSPYNIIADETADLSDWHVISRSTLSTSTPFVIAWPRETPNTPAEYLRFLDVQRAKAGNLWTDLICFSPSAMRYLEPASARS